MQPHADAAVRSIPHSKGEKIVYPWNAEERAAIAGRPLRGSALKFVFKETVVQCGHPRPPPKKRPERNMFAQASLATRPRPQLSSNADATGSVRGSQFRSSVKLNSRRKG
jgi:hypothetical protein